LNINSILIEFIKTGLLFNENISLDASIVVNSNIKDEIFQGAHINFYILNGKINFDNTKFINNEIGFLELKNSNLFFKDKNLILNTDILIDIKSSKHLFSFFNTNKASRKDFKKILINLDYNFLSNQLKFNSAKIDDNKFSDQLFTIIEGFEDNNFNNTIKSRILINEFLRAYAG
jgi:Asp-tRNA(Asn)/Glu-tRNA(Gln) amidotransferase B subunit